MSNSYGHDNEGGIYTGTSFADKTSYGFQLDSVGHLDIEVIRSDDDDVVKLPSTNHTATLSYVDSAATEQNVTFMHPDEYKAHFWSIDAITFRFNNNTGHLEMVVY
jgi:hypothetical protein